MSEALTNIGAGTAMGPRGSAHRSRTPGVETQLRAMANAVDRANRPNGLLLLGAVVAVGFLVYASITARNWMTAKSRFARADADAATVTRLIGEYSAEKARTPDLSRLFPTLAAMGSDIEKHAREVWGVPPGQPVPGVTVGPKQPGRIYDTAVERALTVASIECNVNDQPLEKVMDWLARVESDSFLGPTFVSSLTLNPATSGWQASVRFTTYERKP